MEPKPKHPAIENLLTSLSGRDRVTSVYTNKCVWCGGNANEFRDQISREEYTISGFCQGCQDKTFGE